MFGTDISIDDLFGALFLMIALGLNGAPGIVTAAVIEIDVTELILSIPPIASVSYTHLTLPTKA